MNRKPLITIHMYLAAFFTPAVLLVALSGGLYLVGIKGSVEEEIIYSKKNVTLDTNSASLRSDVDRLLADAGVESYSYDYVKVKGKKLYTRPTSVNHYILKSNRHGVEIVHARPDLQSRMIELHKGHGPTAFKTFQKFFAVSLVFTVLSGMWLGISVTRLRRSTLLTTGVGTVVFVLLLI